MSLQTVDIEAIMLIGIEDRTKNTNEINGKGKIPELIQKFYSDNLNKIPNRYDNHVLAVYTDYETDEYGYYTYFIGAKVQDLRHIPKGMVGRTIPSAHYVILPSAIGEISEVVMQGWQEIWQDQALKRIRAYSSDFELYDGRCMDRQHAQIDIYIAIKD